MAASPLGLSRPAPAPASFKGGVLELKVGAGEGPRRLLDWLVEWGYSREAEVDGAGQFAARGGIIDIFPPTADSPLRVEYFGDQIESIRGFEVSSQSSITRHTEVTLLPAREFPHRQAEVGPALERLRALDFSGCLPEVAEQWRDHIAHLAEAGYFPGVETLYPYLSETPSTLMDYFKAPPVVVLVEPERLRAQAERYRRDIEDLIQNEADHGELPRGLRSGLVPFAQLEARFGQVVGVERVAEPGSADLGWTPPPTLVGRTEAIAKDVGASLRRGDHVVFATRHVDRLHALLDDDGVGVVDIEELNLGATQIPAGTALAVDASLRTGFQLPAASLRVYSDLELFGLARPERRRRRQARSTEASDAGAAFRLEIQTGQLVVHRDHGVGRFQGLRSIDDGGRSGSTSTSSTPAATASSSRLSTWTESSSMWAAPRGRTPSSAGWGPGTGTAPNERCARRWRRWPAS